MLGDNPNIVLFLPERTYWAGVFHFHLNLDRGYAVNRLTAITIRFLEETKNSHPMGFLW
jgi:hypothetical protein